MIFVRIWEGLGNQLFQYAYARAVSLRTSQKVFLDIRETGRLQGDAGRIERKCGLTNFRVKLPVCTNVEHFYPQMSERKNFFWLFYKAIMRYFVVFKYYQEPDPAYHDNLLKLKGNWYLQGWFQNVKYFEEYADIIKKELTPRRKIKISRELQYLLKKKETVSIHIRRGDYKKIANTLSVKYYDNAMKHMCVLVDAPFWIVFSDDIAWCKENIDFGNNVYFVGEKEALQDFEELVVMSWCKNHIIANSTFSWWGAWLNKREEKIVIGPNKWFLKGYYSNSVDILPENWIRESIL